MANGVKIDCEHLKPVPVGDSDWADFSQKSYTVDKTLLIKEILDDNTKVALFTRPRRFGKTTALRMLKAFFEKTPKDTSYLFRPFKIWAAGEKYRAEQGKYPVIYLTFKDVDGETFESAFRRIKMFVARMIGEHRDAIGELGDAEDVARLDRVWREKGTVEDTGDALGLLAQAVHRHCEKALAEGEDPAHAKPVILIDEYDMPVTKASTNGYYKEMTAFMRQFLSGAMKDNVHVRMGIMTGVLRVAKEGILSGLNNPDVWTVFDENYNSYFGFTEDEVREMAEYYGVPEKMVEIKEWYDGYSFAGAEIYNPWSVLKYFRGHCTPKPYWLDTSSNDLITEIVRDLPHDTAKTLESLLTNGRALVPMTQELGPYAQIKERPETLYALLVSSGYLKVVPPQDGVAPRRGESWVEIPNRELETVFLDDIVCKARRYTGHGESDDFSRAITLRNPQAFRDAIQRFLTESVSYFDNCESFFHGMTLGFLAVLRDRYKVESNRESGEGRFDIALTPLVSDFPGVIVEVKAAKTARQNLRKLAQEARDQIDEAVAKPREGRALSRPRPRQSAALPCGNGGFATASDEKNYAAEMTAGGVTDILKLGLAYYKKRVELAR